MSKKRKDSSPDAVTAESPAVESAASDASGKAARKAEKDAAKAAEKAARKAEKAEKAERKAAKHAKKDAEKAEKKAAKSAKADGAPPRFKHVRRKRLDSGKGATPREIGESLVSLFNAGKADEAERTWYHRKIESIEADGTVFDGMKGVAEKSAWWTANHSIRAAKAEGPFVCASGFTVVFTMTIEPKGAAAIEMREVGVYTVENGRIVREQFMGL